MEIIKAVLTHRKLKDIAENTFGDLLKAVVDVGRGLIAIDAELHSDLEALLLENGSEQNDLWGINFYPGMEGDDFIEFDSMINVRPSQGNMTGRIKSKAVKKKILTVVDKWVKG